MIISTKKKSNLLMIKVKLRFKKKIIYIVQIDMILHLK